MIDKMLKYYGFSTLKEFGESLGYYNLADAERSLRTIYEEDMLFEEEEVAP